MEVGEGRKRKRQGEEDEEEEEEEEERGGGGGGGQGHVKEEQTEEEEEAEEEIDVQSAHYIGFESLDEGLKNALGALSSKSQGEVSLAISELRRLLKGSDGGKILQQYVMASPKCVELVSAWTLGPGAQSSVPLLLLTSEIMAHPIGLRTSFRRGPQESQNSSDDVQEGNAFLPAMQLRLDKLARFFVGNKLKDVYSHLNSRERRRQNAALLLMTSIVKRGSMLALEVSTRFDFSLSVLPKLAKPPKQAPPLQKESLKGEDILHRPTRSFFVEFGVALLQASNPSLLRWVLQIRPLYMGILHGLARDSEDTIVMVLNVLNERVLGAAGLVPPGLQSAVFGDSALEQLAIISSDSTSFPVVAQIAHDTLTKICTDPSHGICPDPASSWITPASKAGRFGGGPGRLARLMLKLKATDVDTHRELLLSIVTGRPMLLAAYLDAFPYSLEPRAAPAWFEAISLVCDLIQVGKSTPPFSELSSQGLQPPKADSYLLQSILRSLVPRQLIRVVINRGLLHANPLVKHGCLRALQGMLMSARFYLDAIFSAWNEIRKDTHHLKNSEDLESEVSGITMEQEGLFSDLGTEFETPPSALPISYSNYAASIANGENLDGHSWLALGKWMQNELRASLPDPQIILSLLSVPKQNHNSVRSSGIIQMEEDFDVPILTSLINSKGGDNDHASHSLSTPADNTNEMDDILIQVWGDEYTDYMSTGDQDDLMKTKVIQVLDLYQNVIPLSLLDSAIDVLKLLPEEPLVLPASWQAALLSLLTSSTGDCSPLLMECDICGKSQNLEASHMFKHLAPLLKIASHSKVKKLKKQAIVLSKRALLSCGAFENNNQEASVWLLFVPPWDDVIFLFLCDSVNAIGKNLYKYLDQMEVILSSSAGHGGMSNLQFGPLVLCVLDKCLRILSSEAKGLALSQRVTISVYTSSVLGYLLQMQANPRALALVIDSVLSAGIEQASGGNCEWSPLFCLLSEAQIILGKGGYDAIEKKPNEGGHCGSLEMVMEACRRASEKGCTSTELVAMASALSSSLLCSLPSDIAENLPSLLEVAFQICQGDLTLLSALFAAYRHLLLGVAKSSPDLFNDAMLLAASFSSCKEKRVAQISGFPEEDLHHSNTHDALEKLTPKLEEKVRSDCKADFISSDTMKKSALSALLCALPFPVIFSIAGESCKFRLLKSAPLRTILESALLNAPLCDWQNNAYLILFWVARIEKLSAEGVEVEEQLETCFSLLKCLVVPKNLCAWEESGSIELASVIDLISGVLSHPTLNACFGSLEESLSSSNECETDPLYAELNIHSEYDHSVFDLREVEKWFLIGRSLMPLVRIYTLSLVRDLLNMSFRSSTTVKKGENAEQGMLKRSILQSCEVYLYRTVKSVKCETMRSLREKGAGMYPSSSLYAAFLLAPFMDFHLLVELSLQLLSAKGNSAHISSQQMPHFVLGLYFMNMAFKRISSSTSEYLYSKHDGNDKVTGYLLQDAYLKLVRLFTKKPSSRIVVSTWLTILEAVNHCKHTTSSGKKNPMWLGLSLLTPRHVFEHLMQELDNLKAKTIFQLVRGSSLNAVEFAEYLSCALSSINPRETQSDLILLLPTLHYLMSSETSVGGVSCSIQISKLYMPLIRQTAKEWDHFIENSWLLDPPPLCTESLLSEREIFSLISGTTPGRMLKMLELCHAKNPLTHDEKRDMLLHLFSTTNPILGSSPDYSEHSLESVMKLVVNIYVKTSIMKFLLFSHSTEEEGLEWNATENFKFASLLMNNAGALIPRRIEKKHEEEEIETILPCEKLSFCKSRFLDFLEATLFDHLISYARYSKPLSRNDSIVLNLNRFTKAVLRHRFGDALLMKCLRCIYSSLTLEPTIAGPFARDILKLLVSHSDFMPTLLTDKSRVQFDALLQKAGLKDSTFSSLSSALFLTRLPPNQYGLCETKNDLVSVSSQEFCMDMNCSQEISNGRFYLMDQDALIRTRKKLEVAKLLRLLYHMKMMYRISETPEETSIDSKTLTCLLLSAYGASMSKVDIEIFCLLHEIESFEGAGFSGITEMDYLWGETALKRRQEMSDETQITISSFEPANEENIVELRKRQFKEDLLLDPRRSGISILCFPMKRERWTSKVGVSELLSCDEQEQEKSLHAHDALSSFSYDPAYILPFSMHGLSSGYLEAEDFVKTGLLGIVLVSLSSTVEGIRKIGYEILAKYLSVLEESSSSFQGKAQIRVLLMYMKNAIEEQWQQLPFIHTVFAAEASLVLMHPASTHYMAINRSILKGPSINLETVPLFHSMFRSGSVHFYSDRGWILRLLAYGLQSSQDAFVFRRCYVFEMLMSFFSSPLADLHTREWILQILQKASRLRSTAHYLVEKCGILSWISSNALDYGASKIGEYTFGACDTIAGPALQVLKNLLSWKSIRQWLGNDGFGELEKATMSMFSSFRSGSIHRRTMVFMKRTVLEITMLVFKLSRKRKKFETQLKISVRNLLELVEYVGCDVNADTATDLCHLTLRTITESSPSTVCSLEEGLILLQLGRWMVSVVLQLDPGSCALRDIKSCNGNGEHHGMEIESLSRTALCWLSAVVISRTLQAAPAIERPQSALSLFKCIKSYSSTSLTEGEVNKELLNLLISFQIRAGGQGAYLPLVVSAGALLVCTSRNLRFMEDVIIDQRLCRFVEDLMELLLSELSWADETLSPWQWRSKGIWKTMLDFTQDQSMYEAKVCQTLIHLYQTILFSRKLSEIKKNVNDFLSSGGELKYVPPPDTSESVVLIQMNILKGKITQLIDQS